MPTLTRFTYPKNSTAAGQVNTSILHQELSQASLSVPVGTVQTVGSEIIIELQGRATEADETAIAGVIEAHLGETFQAPYQSRAAHDDIWGQPLFETTDTEWTTVLDFDSGALPQGQYQVLIACEHWVSHEVADNDSECRTQLEVGGHWVEINVDANQSEKPHSFANGMVQTILDGQHLKLRLQVRKAGNDSEVKARLRRARYVQFKVG